MCILDDHTRVLKYNVKYKMDKTYGSLSRWIVNHSGSKSIFLNFWQSLVVSGLGVVKLVSSVFLKAFYVDGYMRVDLITFCIAKERIISMIHCTEGNIDAY